MHRNGGLGKGSDLVCYFCEGWALVSFFHSNSHLKVIKCVVLGNFFDRLEGGDMKECVHAHAHVHVQMQSVNLSLLSSLVSIHSD